MQCNARPDAHLVDLPPDDGHALAGVPAQREARVRLFDESCSLSRARACTHIPPRAAWAASPETLDMRARWCSADESIRCLFWEVGGAAGPGALLDDVLGELRGRQGRPPDLRVQHCLCACVRVRVRVRVPNMGGAAAVPSERGPCGHAPSACSKCEASTPPPPRVSAAPPRCACALRRARAGSRASGVAKHTHEEATPRKERQPGVGGLFDMPASRAW